jgi:hypothetical protein
MEQGVHLVVKKAADPTPTSVCIVRIEPRGGAAAMITVTVAPDVESGGPGTSGSYAHADDALAVVAEFLLRGGASFRSPQHADDGQ